MSGGVDSSTAAVLLHRQGWEVIGVTMKLPHTDTEQSCCGIPGIRDAEKVALETGFTHYAVNFSSQFTEAVINRFISEYLKARTPNPCIYCNRYIKFGSLLNMADDLDAEYIATGHYSRIQKNPDTGRFELLKGMDPDKDQSYFLFPLEQEQLARITFPLGDMTKTEVREYARDAGLSIHSKPGSQEICFISGNYAEFILEHLGEDENTGTQPGPITDLSGKELGTHKGLIHYTIGQRKGIGAFGDRKYVVRIDGQTNSVVIGDDEDLFTAAASVDYPVWVSITEPENAFTAQVRIRHRHPPVESVVTPGDRGKLKIEFNTPQRAVTPGQAAVFYDGDKVLGGGWITS